VPDVVVNATEFKARCLALLDRVDEDGITVTVTRRGRVVATIRRSERTPIKSLRGALAGQVSVPDEFLDADHSGLWNAAGGNPDC
jgi:prevent-host-death family protein